MHGREDLDLAGVQVKRRAIHVLRGLGIAQDRERIIRPIAVMVVTNDLRVELRRSEGRAEVLPDELSLLLRGHEHARIVARMQRFVLDCDGVNPDAFRFHGLDVFHEIVRVRIMEFRP